MATDIPLTIWRSSLKGVSKPKLIAAKIGTHCRKMVWIENPETIKLNGRVRFKEGVPGRKSCPKYGEWLTGLIDRINEDGLVFICLM